MEEWNIGMMGKKNKMPKLIIPLFHYSNIPICLLFGLFFSSSAEGAEAWRTRPAPIDRSDFSGYE
jgi:hypothetical protein